MDVDSVVGETEMLESRSHKISCFARWKGRRRLLIFGVCYDIFVSCSFIRQSSLLVECITIKSYLLQAPIRSWGIYPATPSQHQ